MDNNTDIRGADGREWPIREGANKGEFSLSNGPSPDVNRAYDSLATKIIPVLTSAWAERQNSTIEPGWSDARLVCLRASQIKVGSRVPGGVSELSLGTRMAPGSMVLSLVLAVGFALV